MKYESCTGDKHTDIELVKPPLARPPSTFLRDAADFFDNAQVRACILLVGGWLAAAWGPEVLKSAINFMHGPRNAAVAQVAAPEPVEPVDIVRGVISTTYHKDPRVGVCYAVMKIKDDIHVTNVPCEEVRLGLEKVYK